MEDELSRLLESLTGMGFDKSTGLPQLTESGRRPNSAISTQIAESQFRTRALEEINKGLEAQLKEQRKIESDIQGSFRANNELEANAKQDLDIRLNAMAFGELSPEQVDQLSKIEGGEGIPALARERAFGQLRVEINELYRNDPKNELLSTQARVINTMGEEVAKERGKYYDVAQAKQVFEDLNLAERFENPSTSPGGFAADIIGKAVAGLGSTIELAGTPVDAVTAFAGRVLGAENGPRPFQAIGDKISEGGEAFQQDTFGELIGQDNRAKIIDKYNNGEIGLMDVAGQTFASLDVDSLLDLTTSTLGVLASGGAVVGGTKKVAGATNKFIKSLGDAGKKLGLDDISVASGVVSGAEGFADQEFDSELGRLGGAAVAGVGGALTGLIPGTIEKAVGDRLSDSAARTGLFQRGIDQPNPTGGALNRTRELGVGAIDGATRSALGEGVQEGAQNLVGQATNQFSANPEGFNAGSLVQDVTLGGVLGGATGGTSGAINRGGTAVDPEFKKEFDRQTEILPDNISVEQRATQAQRILGETEEQAATRQANTDREDRITAKTTEILERTNSLNTTDEFYERAQGIAEAEIDFEDEVTARAAAQDEATAAQAAAAADNPSLNPTAAPIGAQPIAAPVPGTEVPAAPVTNPPAVANPEEFAPSSDPSAPNSAPAPVGGAPTSVAPPTARTSTEPTTQDFEGNPVELPVDPEPVPDGDPINDQIPPEYRIDERDPTSDITVEDETDLNEARFTNGENKSFDERSVKDFENLVEATQVRIDRMDLKKGIATVIPGGVAKKSVENVAKLENQENRRLIREAVINNNPENKALFERWQPLFEEQDALAEAVKFIDKLDNTGRLSAAEVAPYNRALQNRTSRDRIKADIRNPIIGDMLNSKNRADMRIGFATRLSDIRQQLRDETIPIRQQQIQQYQARINELNGGAPAGGNPPNPPGGTNPPNPPGGTNPPSDIIGKSAEGVVTSKVANDPTSRAFVESNYRALDVDPDSDGAVYTQVDPTTLYVAVDPKQYKGTVTNNVMRARAAASLQKMFGSLPQQLDQEITTGSNGQVDTANTKDGLRKSGGESLSFVPKGDPFAPQRENPSKTPFIAFGTDYGKTPQRDPKQPGEKIGKIKKDSNGYAIYNTNTGNRAGQLSGIARTGAETLQETGALSRVPGFFEYVDNNGNVSGDAKNAANAALYLPTDPEANFNIAPAERGLGPLNALPAGKTIKNLFDASSEMAQWRNDAFNDIDVELGRNVQPNLPGGSAQTWKELKDDPLFIPKNDATQNALSELVEWWATEGGGIEGGLGESRGGARQTPDSDSPTRSETSANDSLEDSGIGGFDAAKIFGQAADRIGLRTSAVKPFQDSLSNIYNSIENARDPEMVSNRQIVAENYANSDKSPQLREAVAITTALAKKFGIRPPIVVSFDEANRLQNGTTIKYKFGGKNKKGQITKGQQADGTDIIALDDSTVGDMLVGSKAQRTRAVETLNHEFGHYVMGQFLASASEAELAQLAEAYTKWFNKHHKRGRKAASEAVTSLAAPSGKTRSSKNLRYGTKFPEFWADQVGNYLDRELANDATGTDLNVDETDSDVTIVAKFANLLRAVYDAMAAKFNIDPAFDEFIESRRYLNKEITPEGIIIETDGSADINADAVDPEPVYTGANTELTNTTESVSDSRVSESPHAPFAERPASGTAAVNKGIKKLKTKFPGLKVTSLKPTDEIPGYNNTARSAYYRDRNGKEAVYVNPNKVKTDPEFDEAVLHTVISNDSLNKKFGPKLDSSFSGVQGSATDLANFAEDNDIAGSILEADLLDSAKEGDREALSELGRRVLNYKLDNDIVSEADAATLADIGNTTRQWMQKKFPGQLSDYSWLTQGDVQLGQMVTNLRGKPNLPIEINASVDDVSIADEKSTMGQRAFQFWQAAKDKGLRVMAHTVGLVEIFASPNPSLELKMKMQEYIKDALDAGLGNKIDKRGKDGLPITGELTKADIELLRKTPVYKVGHVAIKTALERLSNSVGWNQFINDYADARNNFIQVAHLMRNGENYDHQKAAEIVNGKGSAGVTNTETFRKDELLDQMFAEGGKYQQLLDRFLNVKTGSADADEQRQQALGAFLKFDQLDQLGMSNAMANSEAISAEHRQDLEDILTNLGGSKAEAIQEVDRFMAVRHLLDDQAAFKEVFNPLRPELKGTSSRAVEQFLNPQGISDLKALREDKEITPAEMQQAYIDLFIKRGKGGSYKINTRTVNNESKSNVNAMIRAANVGGINYNEALELNKKLGDYSKSRLALLGQANDVLQRLNDKVDEANRSNGSFDRDAQKKRDMQGYKYRVPEVSRGDAELTFDQSYMDDLASEYDDSGITKRASASNSGFIAIEQANRRTSENATKLSIFLNSLLATFGTQPGLDREGFNLPDGVKKDLNLKQVEDNKHSVKAMHPRSAEFQSLFSRKDGKTGEWQAVNGRDFIIKMENDNFKGEIGAFNEDIESNDMVLVFTLDEQSELHSKLRTPVPQGWGQKLRQVRGENRLARWALKATPFMAATKTRYNPAFPVIQLFRDTSGAWVTAGMNYGVDGIRDFKDAQVSMARHTGDIAKYMKLRTSNKKADRKALKELSGKDASPTMQLFHEYITSGAYVTHESSYRRNSRFIGLPEGMVNRVFSNKASNRIDGTLQTIGLATELTDVWARFAMYQTELKEQARRGITGKEAKQNAAIGTKRLANFEQRGASASADNFRLLYAFYGPAATGAAQVLQTAMRGKYATEAMAIAAAMGTMTIAMGMALSGEDEDGNNRFLTQGDNVTDIKLFLGDAETPVRIHLPFSMVSVAASTMMQLTKLGMGYQSVPQALSNITNNIEHNLFPVQDDVPIFNELGEFTLYNKLNTIMPTFAKPWTSLMANINHFGYDIVRDSGSGSDTLGRGATFDSRTNQIGSGLETIVRGLSNAVGIDLDVRAMDHLVREYGGGIYNFAEGLNEIYNEATLNGYDANNREASLFFGGLFGTPVNSINKEYWKTYKKADAVVRNINKLTSKGVDTLDEAADSFGISVADYNAYKSMISAHRKKNGVGKIGAEAATARFTDTMNAAERQAVIQRVMESQIGVMRSELERLPDNLRGGL